MPPRTCFSQFLCRELRARRQRSQVARGASFHRTIRQLVRRLSPHHISLGRPHARFWIAAQRFVRQFYSHHSLLTGLSLRHRVIEAVALPDAPHHFTKVVARVATLQPIAPGLVGDSFHSFSHPP